MAGAKKRMLDYLLEHIGEEVDRETLRDIAVISDWARSLRLLRQEGYDLETTRNGYILHSGEPSGTGNVRETISPKLRYRILMRDNSICQRCGAKASDGVKLHVDHKIPVEFGGDNSESNLWTLCEPCNEGKKAYFQDLDTELIAEVLREKGARNRLIKLFSRNPGKEFDVTFLSIICAGNRDWTRVIREIRQKEDMNIVHVRKSCDCPNGGYVYLP